MTETPRPLGPNHALLCGLVTGALLGVHPLQDVGRFEVEPEVDGADFTGRTLIRRASGTWAVSVAPVDVQDAEL